MLSRTMYEYYNLFVSDKHIHLVSILKRYIQLKIIDALICNIPLFQSMRSSMVAFNDTKTSSDPPVTHVPFADYVITVASCTVDCILCSFEDT